MPITIDRTQTLAFILSAIAIAVTSSAAQAEVYKWRDARGIVQYSDKPPASGFTKASQSEIVNALQKKELCSADSTGTKTKTSKEAKDLSAFITTFGTAGGASSGVRSIGASTASVTVATATAPKPVTVATATAPKPATAAPAPSAKLSTTGSGWGSLTKLAGLKTINAAPAPAPAPAPSTGSNIIQVGLMPAVDISKNITPAVGHSTLIIRPTTQTPSASDVGAVRIACKPSHMSNDDPLVYPNQQGAAHHHTFYGNTSVNYKSNLATLASAGNSTCNGGIMNRSAYWHATMIDTTTSSPVLADGGALFYYKTGYDGVPANMVVAPPKGLRMLSGNSKATTAAGVQAVAYMCVPPNGSFQGWYDHIPNCKVGEIMQMDVNFPQCWDGKNLDSPDHKSHMAFANGSNPTANRCPATHPVAIPKITMTLNYKIATANQATKWRLSSDNYASSLPGGYSGHADWVNGWDETIMSGIVKNCLIKKLDCHAHLLGDGRLFDSQ